MALYQYVKSIGPQRFLLKDSSLREESLVPQREYQPFNPPFRAAYRAVFGGN
jgi:hypothetical protein